MTTKRTAIISCCLLAVTFGGFSTALAAPARVVKGTVISVEGSSITIQAPGRRGGIVPALIGAANGIDRRNLPYVYGGGHGHAGAPSIGIPGSGYDGHRIGYDCSGAVAAVLVGGGLWPAYSGVPADNGIISQLRAEGKIAPGVGRGPVEVTLYDDPSVHIFMNIDGRFFGTSDGGGGHGGSWLYDGAPDASSPRYHAFHVLPSVLRSGKSGEVFTFTAEGFGPFQPGDKLKISYRESRWGSLIATAISFQNQKTTAGTVTAIADDGSSFTITAADGSSKTLVSVVSGMLDGVAVGDTVQVLYTKRGGVLTARAVTVTATPAPASAPTVRGADPTAPQPSPSTASRQSAAPA